MRVLWTPGSSSSLHSLTSGTCSQVSFSNYTWQCLQGRQLPSIPQPGTMPCSPSRHHQRRLAGLQREPATPTKLARLALLHHSTLDGMKGQMLMLLKLSALSSSRAKTWPSLWFLGIETKGVVSTTKTGRFQTGRFQTERSQLTRSPLWQVEPQREAAPTPGLRVRAAAACASKPSPSGLAPERSPSFKSI